MSGPPSPAVVGTMSDVTPGVALVVCFMSDRRDRATLVGLAVVAFGVAAALAQAAEGHHLVLLPLTMFGGTAALLVMTVRRRVGAGLGLAVLLVGLAAAHSPAAVMGAVGGALVAAVAVGMAIPLWGWLSPRTLSLDDLGPDDHHHDDDRHATSCETSVRGPVR